MKKQSTSGNTGVIQIDSKTAEELKTGKKQTQSVAVVFDEHTQEYKLTEKSKQITHTGSKLAKLSTQKYADIKIVHDLNQSCWKISASSTLKENPPDIKQIEFFVTGVDNPNQLIRSFAVQLHVLFNCEEIHIDFQSETEKYINLVDVYKEAQLNLSCSLH